MHILLVEDNPPDIALFHLALQRFSLVVDLSVAPLGDQALPMLRGFVLTASTAPVDLVFLDLNIPRTVGSEILAEMRADPQLKYIPVVVFSSSLNPVEISRCYELGANAYMVKPLRFDEYLRKIHATICFWQKCQFRTLPSPARSEA